VRREEEEREKKENPGQGKWKGGHNLWEDNDVAPVQTLQPKNETKKKKRGGTIKTGVTGGGVFAGWGG